MTVAETLASPPQMPVSEFRSIVERIEDEVGKVMVGQADIVRDVLISLIAGGHVLLEGVPGSRQDHAGTHAGRGARPDFSRIQFTPDLMPADITGTNILVEDPRGGRQFAFQPGPVFANLVLADEINRATPKTQSALLEAMAGEDRHRRQQHAPLERALLRPGDAESAGDGRDLPATRGAARPLLLQADRALSLGDDLTEIVRRTTAPAPPAAPRWPTAPRFARWVSSHARCRFRALSPIMSCGSTWPPTPRRESPPDVVRRYVRYGVSPRGAQSIVLGSKIRALIEGRLNVAYEDVRAVAAPALRHRLILNFDAESSGVNADSVITELIATIPE